MNDLENSKNHSKNWSDALSPGKLSDVRKEIQESFRKMGEIRQRQLEIGRLQSELDNMPFTDYQEETKVESRKQSNSGDAVHTNSTISTPSSSRPSADPPELERVPSAISVGTSSINNSAANNNQPELTSERMEQSFNRIHEATLRKREHVNIITTRLQELGQKMMQLKEVDMNFILSDERDTSEAKSDLNTGK